LRKRLHRPLLIRAASTNSGGRDIATADRCDVPKILPVCRFGPNASGQSAFCAGATVQILRCAIDAFPKCRVSCQTAVPPSTNGHWPYLTGWTTMLAGLGSNDPDRPARRPTRTGEMIYREDSVPDPCMMKIPAQREFPEKAKLPPKGKGNPAPGDAGLRSWDSLESEHQGYSRIGCGRSVWPSRIVAGLQMSKYCEKAMDISVPPPGG
jgi:hypothetical protein